jgi:hypothetical protein
MTVAATVTLWEGLIVRWENTTKGRDSKSTSCGELGARLDNFCMCFTAPASDLPLTCSATVLEQPSQKDWLRVCMSDSCALKMLTKHFCTAWHHGHDDLLMSDRTIDLQFVACLFCHRSHRMSCIVSYNAIHNCTQRPEPVMKCIADVFCQQAVVPPKTSCKQPNTTSASN